MNLLALCLVIAGVCTAVFSIVWFLVLAFRRHLAWGLAVLLVPFVNLVFLICAWREAKRPFFGVILGLLLLLAGGWHSPDHEKWRAAWEARLANNPPDPGTPAPSAPEAAPPPPPVIDELAELRARDQALRARKAELDPNDAAAAAALARDIHAYNRDLNARAATAALAQNAAARVSLWVADVATAQIPSTPAIGSIAGEPFTVERAVIENGILSLRHGGGVFAEHEFTLFLFLNGRSAAGRNFQVKPESSFGSLHVHMKRLPKNQKLPETQIFITGYGLRLEFGERAGNELPGRIYLCLPDAARSFLAGTFRARVVEKAGVAMSR